MSIEDKAKEIWATFNDDEKWGARLGLFPADKMPQPGEPFTTVDDTRDLAVALMRMS